MKEKIKQYFWNILIWMTQSLNVLTGGNPDQSFSGRTGIAYLSGKSWAKPTRYVINKIFKAITNNGNHCVNSIEWDRVSPEIIEELRSKSIPVDYKNKIK